MLSSIVETKITLSMLRKNLFCIDNATTPFKLLRKSFLFHPKVLERIDLGAPTKFISNAYICIL